MSVLDVLNLSVKYPDGFMVHDTSFSIDKGEVTAIIGESGSGKTTLAGAIAKIGNSYKHGEIKGTVVLDSIDISVMNESEFKNIRMTKLAVVFQNSKINLNPKLNLYEQLYEVLIKKYPKNKIKEKCFSLLEEVHLQNEDLYKYPDELSGGMISKFMLAVAISLDPALIILDEPTSALDLKSREEFINLINRLRQEKGIAFLLISHDLDLAYRLSQNIIVLYKGMICEQGITQFVIDNPAHPYTAGLIRSDTGLSLFSDLWGIRQGNSAFNNTGCPFCDRCTQSQQICFESYPQLINKNDRLISCHRGGIITVLEVHGLSKKIKDKKLFDNVSFDVKSGECVIIIGESGSGKTTLLNVLLGLLKADSGEVVFHGNSARISDLLKIKGGIQPVFQEIDDFINPSMTVLQALSEPSRLSEGDNIISTVKKCLKDVGLSDDDSFLNSKVNRLSGGQKQRIAVARALTMSPVLLIADEITSMLDASTKANMLRMLKGLQNEYGFSMLMVTHDIAAARKIADKVYLLFNKQLVMIDRRIEVQI